MPDSRLTWIRNPALQETPVPVPLRKGRPTNAVCEEIEREGENHRSGQPAAPLTVLDRLPDSDGALNAHLLTRRLAERTHRTIKDEEIDLSEHEDYTVPSVNRL